MCTHVENFDGFRYNKMNQVILLKTIYSFYRIILVVFFLFLFSFALLGRINKSFLILLGPLFYHKIHQKFCVYFNMYYM